MKLYQKLIGAVCVLLIVAYVKFCLKRRRLYKFADKMPGLSRFWIPGLEGLKVAFQFIGKNNQEIFDFLCELCRSYDRPSKVWLLNKCYLIIEKPEDVQVIFNSPNSLEKMEIQKVSLPVHKGLICGTVETWRPHRKYLSPAFKPSILRSFHPTTNKKAINFVKNLENRVGKGEFNVYMPLLACACDAILESMFGMDTNFMSNENHEFLESISVSAKYYAQKMPKIWLHYKPILMLTKYHKIEQELLNSKHGPLSMADKIMEANQFRKLENYDAMKTEGNSEDEDDYDVGKKQRILVDYFIANKLNWPKDELRDEINTVLLAGFDTSALTMAGCILMLAMHPNFQKKVVEELRQVFRSADEEVTEEHLKKLVYLEYVINETMRLYPVVPMQTRQTTGDVELEDFTIPEGVEIFMPLYLTQRNKKYWGEDAHLFNPDRFYPDRFSKVPSYAFNPFANGPRICLGMRYGMAVMKIILSHFFRKYKVKTQLNFQDIKCEFYLTIKIKQNYMVELEKRKF